MSGPICIRCGPDERIEFSELGGYLDLVRDINAHRYYLGLQLQRDIGRDEAVADWYDNVYMPIVQVIREHDMLKQFPGRTEADLYRWIMDHRWYMRERSGADPGPEAAATEYAALFGRKSLAGALEGRAACGAGRAEAAGIAGSFEFSARQRTELSA